MDIIGTSEKIKANMHNEYDISVTDRQYRKVQSKKKNDETIKDVTLIVHHESISVQEW